MSRFAASLLAGVLFASGAAAVGACGSFSADGDSPSPGPAADAAGADVSAVDGGTDDAAAITDGGPGDAPGSRLVEIAHGLSKPWSIAVDPSHLYVTTHAAPGEVLQLAHDGTGATVFATGLASPTDISIGPQYAHWLAGKDVWRRPLAADQPATPYTPSSTPVGLVTRPSGNIVFGTVTTSDTPGGLIGASPDFGNIDFLTNQGDVASIALVVDSAIFVGLGATGGPQGLRRYDFGSTFGQPLPQSALTFGAVTVMAADSDRVVFAEASGDVHELATAGFAATAIKSWTADGGAVVGIVLDEARHGSYWLTANGVVHREAWSTATVSTEAQGCAAPAGLAQDDSHLYWTCPVGGTIERLDK